MSAYSLVGLTRGALPLLHAGSSILTLTYYGAEKVVANYNVMGVAKAALEASVRYLAADLGPDGIRVNAISAGPVRTLAAAGIGGFKKMYGEFADIAPLRANITIEDVGRTAVYLASDLSSAVTGEVIYVDGGFSVLGRADRGLSPRASARAGEVLRHRGVVDLRPVGDQRRRRCRPSRRRPRSRSPGVRLTRIVSAVSSTVSAAEVVGDRRVGQRDEHVAAGEDHGRVRGLQIDGRAGRDVERAGDDVADDAELDRAEPRSGGGGPRARAGPTRRRRRSSPPR